jgi:hypothetical protein
MARGKLINDTPGRFDKSNKAAGGRLLAAGSLLRGREFRVLSFEF